MRKVVLLPVVALVLALLACSVDLDDGGTSTDDSVQATMAALSVQQTAAALEATSQYLSSVQQQAAQATSVAATVAASGGAQGPAQQPNTVPPNNAPPTSAPPTAAPPTSAPVSVETAVPGSLTRAAWDPASDWGDPHNYDSFDDSKGLFGDFSAGASRAWYGDDDRFHLTFTTRGRSVWSWSFLSVNDFYADVVIFNGDECVSGDSAGIIYRGDQLPWDLGYMFGINCGGEYNIQATGGAGSGGVIWPIINGTYGAAGAGWKRSDLIDTGPGAVNRVGVWGDGGQFDFYINGTWVDSFSYWTLPAVDRWPQGQFALYLGTGQKDKAAVSFEDFSVWEGVQH